MMILKFLNFTSNQLIFVVSCTLGYLSIEIVSTKRAFSTSIKPRLDALFVEKVLITAT